jgi:hypothetical protein
LRKAAESSADWLDRTAPLRKSRAAEAGNPADASVFSSVVPSIRLFDHAITGRILVKPDLATDEERLRRQAEQAGADWVECPQSETEHIFDREAKSQWWLGLSGLRLHGIDFELFDPRDL